MRHQRHLGKVETLTQQVDADQHVELAEAQGAQDLDALDGVDVAVQVAHPQTLFEQVLGEVFGHLLRQRGDQDAVASGDPIVDHLDQVVDLALRRPDDDLGIDQAGRSHDLLDDLLAVRISYGEGVADMKMHWLMRPSTSSNCSGRLSRALGSRKPCSTRMSLRDRSPMN